MNCIYALCFAFCLVGCQGTETFDPFSEILKSGLEKLRTGGNMRYSKRAAFGMFQGTRRNTIPESSDQVQQGPDFCMAAFACQSNPEAIAPTGNLTEGFLFDDDNLQAACNNIAQIVECYDRLARLEPCGTMSTLIVNVFRELQGSLCNTSWAPEIRSLLECMSDREMQLHLFGEVMKLSSAVSAFNELEIPMERQRPLVCRRQSELFNSVMLLSDTECDGTVSTTWCNILTRLYPYEQTMLSMIADVGVTCPMREVYGCGM